MIELSWSSKRKQNKFNIRNELTSLRTILGANIYRTWDGLNRFVISRNLKTVSLNIFSSLKSYILIIINSKSHNPNPATYWSHFVENSATLLLLISILQFIDTLSPINTIKYLQIQIKIKQSHNLLNGGPGHLIKTHTRINFIKWNTHDSVVISNYFQKGFYFKIQTWNKKAKKIWWIRLIFSQFEIWLKIEDRIWKLNLWNKI